MQLVVHVHTPDGLETGESLDLSARGILLRSPVAVAVGTRLDLKFHPPTWSRPLLVQGVVVRHAGSARKLGIRFVDVPAGCERDLAAFVDGHLRRRPVGPSADSAPPTATRVADLPTETIPACDERRAEPRVSGRFRVVFRSGEHFLAEYATSLSRNGLFIETALPLAIGTELEIDLVVPLIAERLSVRGRVVRRVPEAPGRRGGVGLALLDGPGSQLVALHELAGLFRRRPID